MSRQVWGQTGGKIITVWQEKIIMVLCTDLSYNNFSDFEKLFTTLESYSEVLDLDEIIFANDFERNNPVNMNEWNY